ncbi:MAG: FG-GAP repeat protein, partial [Phycisphaerales bacterium]|nr:FG-GAP repeat protein [Phycisphaerales bacterium]
MVSRYRCPAIRWWVGAPFEQSNATGVNGNQNDNSAGNAGAVYVFVLEGTSWRQQAYLKASNASNGGESVFGWSVGISGDTIVIGAPSERSNATGVNGNQS